MTARSEAIDIYEFLREQIDGDDPVVGVADADTTIAWTRESGEQYVLTVTDVSRSGQGLAGDTTGVQS